MRYRSEDRLCDFEFHDSEWTLVSRDGDLAAFGVKYLNIHADAPEDPGDCDMELEGARLVLTGFGVLSFETADGDGAAGPGKDGQTAAYTGDKAEELLLDELRHGLTCVRFQRDESAWTLYGCGEAPFFTAKLTFRQAAVEWDAYRRPAWYVLLARGIRA